MKKTAKSTKTTNANAEQSGIESAVVKSITPKILNGNKAPSKEQANANQTLGHIKGVVTQSFVHNTKLGENIGFKGDFFARDVKGQVLESEAVFLPQSATEQLLRQLDGENNEIALDCRIGVTASDKNPQGYAFVVDEPRTKARIARRKALRDSFMDEYIALDDSEDSEE